MSAALLFGLGVLTADNSNSPPTDLSLTPATIPTGSSATPATTITARYWRLNILAVVGEASINEIQFGQLGGLAHTPVVATATNQYSTSYTPAKAIDGSAATDWVPLNATLPVWFALDYGSPVAVNVVRLRGRSGTGGAYHVDFDVEYSSDGTTWALGWSVRGAASGAKTPDLRSFPKPDNGRVMWRLNVTGTVGGTAAGLAEVEMFDAVNGTDLLGPTTPVLASSYYSGGSNYGSLAVDGNGVSLWSANTGVASAYLDFELDRGRQINQLRLYPRTEGGTTTTNASPSGFTLQSSPDGLTWTTERTVTGLTAADWVAYRPMVWTWLAAGTIDLAAIPESLAAGTAIATVVGTDPDGDALTYTIGGGVPFGLTAPDQLTIQGALSGTYSITLTATDPFGSSYAEAFTLTVKPAWKAGPPVGSNFLLVQDLTNDWTLYEIGADSLYGIASISKLMTALLTMEYLGSDTSQTITITSADVTVGAQTKANLTAGDVLTVLDLLYCLILPSGGDAAYALGRVIGDQIYAAAGSTGTQGMTRFVERMNARAVELGCVSTTFYTPSGVDGASTGATSKASARDVKKFATAALANTTIRTVAKAASRLVTVTGANARTFTTTHTSNMVTDDFVLASKGGNSSTYNPVGGTGPYSLVTLWQAPNGQEVLIVALGTQQDLDRYLDTRGVIYELTDDFLYLGAYAIGTDAFWTNVKLMAGFGTGIVDESAVARTLTAVGGVTVTNVKPVIGAQSLLTDGVDDRVEAADAADLSPGSGDFTLDFWFRGNGAAPTNHVAFVTKWNTVGSQREYSIQWDFTLKRLTMFVSTTGSDFPGPIYLASDITPAVLFNGAKRHIRGRKVGSTIEIYLDGERGSSTITAATIFNSTAKFIIGMRLNGTTPEYPFAGKIDEVRLTIGTARDTTRFTPKAVRYPRS